MIKAIKKVVKEGVYTVAQKVTLNMFKGANLEPHTIEIGESINIKVCIVNSVSGKIISILSTKDGYSIVLQDNIIENQKLVKLK